jgi:hypothetical protein
MGPILEMFAFEGNPNYSFFNNKSPVIEFAYKNKVVNLTKAIRFDIKDEYKT